MPYLLQVRRGVTINTDPQRRCYNGAHFSYRVEWSAWEPWIHIEYPTTDDAEYAKRLFQREDLQFKVVPK